MLVRMRPRMVSSTYTGLGRVLHRSHHPKNIRMCSSQKGLQARQQQVTTFARNNAGTIYNIGMTASLCAFMATDLLTLRCLAVFGTSCAVWFNYQRAPPWNAVIWGLLFIAVNVVRIGQIMHERRQPNFSAEELDIYSRHFHAVCSRFPVSCFAFSSKSPVLQHGVSTQQFAKLMDAAQWRQQSTFLIDGGEEVSTGGEVWLMYDGGIQVTSQGDLVCTVDHSEEFPW